MPEEILPEETHPADTLPDEALPEDAREEHALAEDELGATDSAPAEADENAEPASAAPAEASDKHWFIIHTYSGFEKKVKESLESRVAAFGLQEKIGRMMIPTEDVVEVRGGKKLVSSRMLYPGYVLVEMDMDDYTWHVVRNTPLEDDFRAGKVTLFDRDEYVRVVCDFLERLRPEVVIQRLSGDAPPDYLVAPQWCLDKPALLRAIDAELERRGSWQGCAVQG